MKDIVIIGSGGLSKEVFWLIEDINKESLTWNFLGFIGDDNWVINNKDEICVACAIASPLLRKKVIEKFVLNDKINYPTLIHPTVHLNNRTLIGNGVIIFSKCLVSVDSQIGNFVFMNFGCFIGHDTKISDYVTINTNSVISGSVIINDSSLIGVNSTILENTIIGKNVTIGIGSVVTNNIMDDVIAMGYPARPLIKRKINE
jgi:sugar O-acyltransferase (sialic acid O-acetyltransferase NeuD family)